MKRSLFAALAALLICASSVSADVRRLEFPGGWYSDAGPRGACAVAVQSLHIALCDGRVLPLPPGGDPLQLVLARDGVRFAGTGWHDGQAWEWTGTEYAHRGDAFGNRANIYDRNDQLVTVRAAGTFTGSIGWRYLDDVGALIASWQTYDPSTEMSRARGIVDLWEWTEHGDIICGQGPGGLDCLIRGRRVRVEPGSTQFVNYHREGNAIALTTMKPGSAVVIFATAQDLDALPTVVLGTPLPPVVTPPPPPPPVVPPPVAQRPDHADDVAKLAEQFPFDKGTVDGIFNFVRRVAWTFRDEGVGLLEKPGGENIISYQGKSYSISRVCYALHGGALPAQGAHIFKILSDAGPGGSNGPKWEDEDKREDMKCLPALPPDGDTGPPPPPPPTSDVKKLQLRIGMLEMQVAALQGEVENLTAQRDTATAVVLKLTDENAHQKREIEDLHGQVEEFDQKLARIGCRGFVKAFGTRIPASCEVIRP